MQTGIKRITKLLTSVPICYINFITSQTTGKMMHYYCTMFTISEHMASFAQIVAPNGSCNQRKEYCHNATKNRFWFDRSNIVHSIPD